jgi:hypothetical protein
MRMSLLTGAYGDDGSVPPGDREQVPRRARGGGAGLAVAEGPQPGQQPIVALERGPDAGQDVQVVHQGGGLNAVAGVLVADPGGQLQPLDRLADGIFYSLPPLL